MIVFHTEVALALGLVVTLLFSAVLTRKDT